MWGKSDDPGKQDNSEAVDQQNDEPYIGQGVSRKTSNEAPNTSKHGPGQSSTSCSSNDTYCDECRRQKRDELVFNPIVSKLASLTARSRNTRRKPLKRKLPKRKAPTYKAASNRRKKPPRRSLPPPPPACRERSASSASASSLSSNDAPPRKKRHEECEQSCCMKRCRKRRPRSKPRRAQPRAKATAGRRQPVSRQKVNVTRKMDVGCQEGSTCAMLSPLCVGAGGGAGGAGRDCGAGRGGAVQEVTLEIITEAVADCSRIRAVVPTIAIATHIANKHGIQLNSSSFLEDLDEKLEMAAEIGMLVKVGKDEWAADRDRLRAEQSLTHVGRFRAVHMDTKLRRQNRDNKPAQLPSVAAEGNKHNPYLDEDII